MNKNNLQLVDLDASDAPPTTPQPPLASDGGDDHSRDMDKLIERLGKLENEVHAIKGSLDWAKVAFAFMGAVILAGFGLLATLSHNTSSKVDGISSKITEEFRAQRADQAATISALGNAITATKQQSPQVILVPAPAPEKAPK
ncbi:hypothetical protein VPG91_11650 [Nitrospirillum amazonense]|uniref:hypothetical protein n=1 Tax=Nitrospirillum amazonense TaxID=28077 RepID=UPI002DD44123|nr:hypothetical protein [Nitrospirillum amazonense]MEC4591644.1 hypothetical protein [Nitrospirillum amazonense]